MPKLQVEFGRSHFDPVPKELVSKIMIEMSLNDRLNFLEVYPRFLKLAKSSALKTRFLTRSDIFMERQDLEKVLDLEGTNIQVRSFSCETCKYSLRCECYSLLNLDVFHLMPNLQVVTFNNCELMPSKCLCQDEIIYTFFDCQSWKTLLTKVRCLEFNNCEHDSMDKWFTMWSWRTFFHRVFFSSDSNISLREVIMRNSLTQRDFKKLMCELVTWILTSGLNSSDVRMEIQTPERESIDIARIIFAPSENFGPSDMLQWYLDALRKTLGWPEYSIQDESKKCLKFEMTKDVRGIPKVKLTEVLDMAMLRKEFADLKAVMDGLQLAID